MRIKTKFIVKPIDKAWRVYDTDLGSFPYDRPSIGKVTQDVSKAEAEAEAERLNVMENSGAT